MDSPNKDLAVIVIATNKYFPLGLRLVNNWSFFYSGSTNYKIFFMSDQDPAEFMPDNMLDNVIYHNISHPGSLMDIYAKKFLGIKRALDEGYENILYIDSDTKIMREFTDKDFMSQFSIVRHYINDFTSDYNELPFDKNSSSRAFVDPASLINPVYYHACIFGGSREFMSNLVFVCMNWLFDDRSRSVIPVWHDESYINKYVNVVINRVFLEIPWNGSVFDISNKGASYEGYDTGISPIDKLMDWNSVRDDVRANRNMLLSIDGGKYLFD